MQFRTATLDEFEQVMQFYYDLIDAMKDAPYHPEWQKDIYPTRAFIQESIAAKELTMVLEDQCIIGAMVLNHHYADGYEQMAWKVSASKDEVMVIHALGLLPQHQGKGIAKKMVEYAADLCRQKKMKAIRLDVLSGNVPAQKLYTSMGFAYIGTTQLFYEDTGVMDFLLYELPL